MSNFSLAVTLNDANSLPLDRKYFNVTIQNCARVKTRNQTTNEMTISNKQKIILKQLCNISNRNLHYRSFRDLSTKGLCCKHLFTQHCMYIKRCLVKQSPSKIYTKIRNYKVLQLPLFKNSLVFKSQFVEIQRFIKAVLQLKKFKSI